MDIVKDVVAHLSDDLGVRVAAERPENPDERMVTVRRVGGGGDRFMDTARIDVTAWAESYSAAYNLAKLAERSNRTASTPTHTRMGRPDGRAST